MHKKNQGFTLLELFAAIVVILVVVAVAYPSYQAHLLKSRRSDGIVAILDIQAAQERFRTSNATYGTLTQVWGTTTASPRGLYTLSVSDNSATGYVITATATGAQAADTACSAISLTKSGATETRAPAVCWQ